ncbi:MAG: hypothetical protein AAB975_04140 [Patescibacteria group bacterium]
MIIHLIPFILYGNHPLGYDTGFYRRYVIQPILSFPNTPVPGLGKDALGLRMLLDVLRFIPLPSDVILYGSYIFIFAVQIIALFFLAKHYWGARIGCIAAVLFTLSPIQYTAFWYMLFKNAFALPLMLFTFLLIEKQSRWAIMTGTLVMISHHTTSIIFLTSLVLCATFSKEKQKVALQIFIAALPVFLYLHISSIYDYLAFPVAIFMPTREYITLSLPLFGLALYGIKSMIVDKKSTVFVSFAAVSVVFPLLSLPFYERMFIFTDIAIVMAAAIGLQNTYKKIKKTKEKTTRYGLIIFICVLVGWIALTTYNQIHNLRPLISPEQLHALENIPSHVPADAAILTSTVLAPWVGGWSQHYIIAPGMHHDAHSLHDWVSFWNGSRDYKISFLNNFPRPLYFFLSLQEKQKFTANLNDCIREESFFLLQYICNTIPR